MPDVFDRLKEALSDRYAIEREISSGGMTAVRVLLTAGASCPPDAPQ